MLIPLKQDGQAHESELDAKAFLKEDLEKYWEELEPFIQKSVDVSEGDLTVDFVKTMLFAGHATLFATLQDNRIQMVIVVEVVAYATYRSARIICCAGRKIKEALRYIEALEVWALSYGAVQIEGWCRPAVVRFLRRLGFKPGRTMMVRDLRRKLQ